MLRRGHAVWVLGLLSGCPRFTEPFACGPECECVDGLECAESTGLCCEPLSCGDRCGEVTSACGLAIECGGCGPAERCEENLCSRAPSCRASDLECGFAASGDWCGGCGDGARCEGGRCVSAPPLCWSAHARLAPEPPEHRVVPVREADGVWLYSATDAFADADPACTRHARMKLLGPTRAATAAVERIPSLDLPTQCSTGTTSCAGYVSVPFVRADGLELFFSSNYPCNDAWETYVAHRRSVAEAWSTPKRIAALTTKDGEDAGAVILLPDHRTIIASRNQIGWAVARRTSTVAGDAGFVEDERRSSFRDEGELRADDILFEMNPESLSCDGTHLIYSRSFDLPNKRWDLRVVPIIDPSVPRFGVPMKHSDYPMGALEFPQRIVESADCEVLWVRSRNTQWYATRVACE